MKGVTGVKGGKGRQRTGLNKSVPVILGREKINELAEETIKKLLELMKPSMNRLSENLDRATNLVKIYNDLYGKGRGRRAVHKADLLRAAVVFIHASLEDFLRSLAVTHLPRAGENVLNDIPLKGLSSSGRPEKFYLGKLVLHRGKFVDDLIEESVIAYIERSNFNNTQEISALLTSIGIDVSKVKKVFPDLEKMMKRRHLIVHRADRIEKKGQGKQIAQSINATDVNRWIKTTKSFMGLVLTQSVFRKEKIVEIIIR